MLERLHQSLSEWHGSVRTGHMVQEERAEYVVNSDTAWQHADRFPEDFMLVLTQGEMDVLRSQIVTSKTETRGGTQYAPMAFTEQGVAMLSSVLNSQRAIEVNIAIMRAFVRLREFLASQAKLGKKLAEIERRIEEHHESIHVLFEAIQQLASERPPAIGFQYVGAGDDRPANGKTVKERRAKYRTTRVKQRAKQQ